MSRSVKLKFALLLGLLAAAAFGGFSAGVITYHYNILPEKKLKAVKAKIVRSFRPLSESSLKSEMPGGSQRVFYYKARGQKRPLVVYLHMWNSDSDEYNEKFVSLILKNDYNYVQPSFGGPANHERACCSDEVIKDVDAAIDFGVKTLGADADDVRIVGYSGGGYTALCYYLKGARPVSSVKTFSAISDLNAWHLQSERRGYSFAKDILACTGSGGSLNEEKASARSPIYMPLDKFSKNSPRLTIYAGIRDGRDGTVPISHSINFFNRLAEKLGFAQASVSANEALFMAENLSFFGEGSGGSMQGRKVWLSREALPAKLAIFEGGHDFLEEEALETSQNDEGKPK